MDALDGSSKIFLATSGTAVLGDVNGAAEDAAVPNHPFSARAQAEVLLAQVSFASHRTSSLQWKCKTQVVALPWLLPSLKSNHVRMG